MNVKKIREMSKVEVLQSYSLLLFTFYFLLSTSYFCLYTFVFDLSVDPLMTNSVLIIFV
jgi:hypothetical protein